MPIARSLIRLHHEIVNPDTCKLALNLTFKASHLPGITRFTRALVMAPSFSNRKTYVPMRFATEEQAARGKGQTVNVMHIWEHITSYEIFTEEVDGDAGQGKVEGGERKSA